MVTVAAAGREPAAGHANIEVEHTRHLHATFVDACSSFATPMLRKAHGLTTVHRPVPHIKGRERLHVCDCPQRIDLY